MEIASPSYICHKPSPTPILFSMQEPQFTEEQQAYINELRNTLRGEFESTNDRERSTLKEVEDLKQDALMALKHTLKYGDNESIKAKVAMWTITTILDAQKANDSPLAEFLKGLPTPSEPTPIEN